MKKNDDLQSKGPTSRRRRIDLIVVHCTATRCNIPLSPEKLEEMHRQRGFRQCGYHFYITRDGLVVHAMRPVEMEQAHGEGNRMAEHGHS